MGIIMSIAETLSVPSRFFPLLVRRVLDAVRKTKSNPSDKIAALRRLETTSPHLMHDVGFRVGSDGTWTNGRTKVTPAPSRSEDLRLRAGRI